MAAKRTKGQTTLFKRAHPRDPEILDVQATADALGPFRGDTLAKTVLHIRLLGAEAR